MIFFQALNYFLYLLLTINVRKNLFFFLILGKKNLSYGHAFALFAVNHLKTLFHADIRLLVDLIYFLFNDIRLRVGLFISETHLFLFQIVI